MKALKHIALGAALALTMATGAQAELKEVNMFGASAQFDFWTAAAPTYLTSKGCAAGDIVWMADKGETVSSFSKRDYLVAVCKGDVAVHGLGTGSGDANGDTLVIRYSTHASAEGVRAVLNDNSAVTECPGLGFRGFAQTWTGTGSAADVTLADCKEVHGGASDVAAATFNFSSYGAESGPCGGAYKEESVTGLEVNSDTITFKPLAVPFAFFGHSALPFSNIARSQAVLLFSGQIADWNFFATKSDLNGNGVANEAATYPAGDSLPMKVCMRHAASGTQATLLASVMRGDAAPDGYENPYSAPYIYYNKGSSEMINCIAGSAVDASKCPAGNLNAAGSIGVIDADKISAAPATWMTDGAVGGTAPYQYKRLTYNGYSATKDNIVRGNYDFWGAQHLYQAPTDAQTQQDMIADLVAFASNPANIALMGAKANFWAAQDEMMVTKDTDFAMPKVK